MNLFRATKESIVTGPRSSLKMILVVLLMAFTNVRADSSGNEGFGMIIVGGMGIIGTTIGCAGLGTYSAIESSGAGVAIVVGVLAAMSGVTGSRVTSLMRKELVVQLKVDHETYLAGGEKTPYLQEIYREIRIKAKFYSRIDPETGVESIDEEKMTAAIDRMVELSEQAQPLN